MDDDRSFIVNRDVVVHTPAPESQESFALSYVDWDRMRKVISKVAKEPSNAPVWYSLSYGAGLSAVTAFISELLTPQASRDNLWFLGCVSALGLVVGFAIQMANRAPSHERARRLQDVVEEMDDIERRCCRRFTNHEHL